MADGESENLLETLTGVVAVVTLPLGIFAGMFLGGEAAGVVFIGGWLLLVPLLGILSDYVDEDELDIDTDIGASDSTTADEDDAIQRLRERYAAGEIDDVEFERKVERLLETEDPERAPSLGGPTEVDTHPERERERDRT